MTTSLNKVSKRLGVHGFVNSQRTWFGIKYQLSADTFPRTRDKMSEEDLIWELDRAHFKALDEGRLCITAEDFAPEGGG